MSLANDLENLEQLRNRGALSETEYSQAKARLLQQPETPRPNASSLNGLRRSNVDRWLGGVCGGLARFSGVDAWLWLGVSLIWRGPANDVESGQMRLELRPRDYRPLASSFDSGGN